jgi:hypothetical protein
VVTAPGGDYETVLLMLAIDPKNRDEDETSRVNVSESGQAGGDPPHALLVNSCIIRITHQEEYMRFSGEERAMIKRTGPKDESRSESVIADTCFCVDA